MTIYLPLGPPEESKWPPNKGDMRLAVETPSREVYEKYGWIDHVVVEKYGSKTLYKNFLYMLFNKGYEQEGWYPMDQTGCIVDRGQPCPPPPAIFSSVSTALKFIHRLKYPQ